MNSNQNQMLTTQSHIKLESVEQQPRVVARYMLDDRKKYNLGGSSLNLEKLKKDQYYELNSLLVSLKTEYDSLTRENSFLKEDTDTICKQIKMIEKIDRKNEKKLEGLSNALRHSQSLVEIKKQGLEREEYTRSTLQSMHDRMFKDLSLITKEIKSLKEIANFANKDLRKEKINETGLKERVNKLFSKEKLLERRNDFEKNEHDLVLQYYHTILDQKWQFSQSSEERKNRQRKIALDAKLDNQDKEEVDYRKSLFTAVLYNKYIRKRMQAEFKNYGDLERVYLEIKKITALSDLNEIENRILNADKTYNLSIAKISDKERKLEETKADILKLKELYNEEKRKVFCLDNIEKADNINAAEDFKIEEDMNKETLEEKELLTKLIGTRRLQEKVKLIYDQVIVNLNNLMSTSFNKLESGSNTPKKSMSISTQPTIPTTGRSFLKRDQYTIEEELLMSYNRFLENLNSDIDLLFLSHNREHHLNIMKQRALEKISESKKATPTFRDLDSRSKKKRKSAFLETKPGLRKSASTSGLKITNDEYNYFQDPDDMKEDEEIKKEIATILNEAKVKDGKDPLTIKLDKSKITKDLAKKI